MLWFFANESKFCVIYSCIVLDTARGDKGKRTDLTGFAVQVCLQHFIDQPSQAVLLVGLTKISLCSKNTGPAVVGVFQLVCSAVKAGDEQGQREVYFHVAELNPVLAC